MRQGVHATLVPEGAPQVPQGDLQLLRLWEEAQNGCHIWVGKHGASH